MQVKQFEGMEIFKDIKGYEGYYQISNFGNVKSFKWGKIRILKFANNNKGYLVVTLCKNGIKNQILAHRLVIEHFIKNPLNKPFTNHKDCDKKNNHYTNLEWVTNSENLIHAHENGISYAYPKKVYQYCVRTLRYLGSFESMNQLTNELNYSKDKVRRAIKNMSKTRDGYYYSHLSPIFFTK